MGSAQCLLTGRLQQHDLVVGAPPVKRQLDLESTVFRSDPVGIIENLEGHDAGPWPVILNEKDHACVDPLSFAREIN
jgi:hypothetical protein